MAQTRQHPRTIPPSAQQPEADRQPNRTADTRRTRRTSRMGRPQNRPHTAARARHTHRPSTITSILHRNGRIIHENTHAAHNWQRFEHPYPNALWQMDFKGHFATDGGRCHPLTVIDDRSRYNIILRALANERREGVQAALTEAFRQYGLPDRINTDNGAPWGDSAQGGLTRLAYPTGHPPRPQPSAAPADQRQRRTFPPQPESRSAQRQNLWRTNAGTAGI